MVATFDIRKFRQRDDVLATELKGDRPQLILSQPALHQLQLLIGSPVINAKHGISHGCCEIQASPSMDKASQADLKQIWTIPLEREMGPEGRFPSRVLKDEFVQTVRDGLRDRFTPAAPSIDSSRLDSLGRVTFVSLRGSRADQNGDLVAMRRLLWEQARVKWPGDPDLVPCVVIANDIARETRGRFACRIATVVPAMEAPDFRSRFSSYPTIAIPGRTDSVLSIFPQLLMSVSTAEEAARLHHASGDLTSWIVDGDELKRIIRHACTHFGVSIEWPTILNLT